MYIDSNKIKIYPTANRLNSFDRYANLNLEQNITQISNNIADLDSYIVYPFEISKGTITNNILPLNITFGRCVIHGYNINIFDETLTDPIIVNIETPNEDTTFNIFLTLNIITTDGLTNLIGIDNSIDKYTGAELIVMTGNDIPVNAYQLNIASISYDKSTDTWGDVIPVDQSIKFKSENVNITIDENIGLTKSQIFNGTFSDWLNKEFIIDDGEI